MACYWFKPDLDALLVKMAAVPGPPLGPAWTEAIKPWIADYQRRETFGTEMDQWVSSRAADRSQDLNAIRKTRIESCVTNTIRHADAAGSATSSSRPATRRAKSSTPSRRTRVRPRALRTGC